MLSTVPIAALEQLFDQVPDVAFFIKDSQGRNVAVNHSLLARHGLSCKQDAIGKKPSDICSGEFVPYRRSGVPNRCELAIRGNLFGLSNFEHMITIFSLTQSDVGKQMLCCVRVSCTKEHGPTDGEAKYPVCTL